MYSIPRLAGPRLAPPLDECERLRVDRRLERRDFRVDLRLLDRVDRRLERRDFRVDLRLLDRVDRRLE